MSSWVVVLDGVAVAGGDDVPAGAGNVVGCFDAAPDGLGVPGLRTEDQTYPQRDGADHFADWYEPRIITIAAVTIQADESCPDCFSTRAMVKLLMETWARRCADDELVIYTDCNGEGESGTVEDREVVGPFGVRGRPRVAALVWDAAHKVATVTLRFDSADHRLFILDEEGTPGSGQACEDLTMNYGVGVSYEVALSSNLPADYWPLDDLSSQSDSPRQARNTSSPTWPGFYSDDDLLQRPPLAPNLGPSVVFSNDQGNNFRTHLGSERGVEFWTRFISAPTAGFLWSTDSGSFINITGGGSAGTLGWEGDAFPLDPGPLAALTDGGTHHVFVRVATTSLQLFVDGALAQSETLSAANAINPGAIMTMGQRASSLALYRSNSGAFPDASDIAYHHLVGSGGAPTPIDVAGNLCVPLVITFTGPLTSAAVRTEDGSFVGIGRNIEDGESVVIDTENGTARLLPADVSVLSDVVGDPFLTVPSGTSNLYGVSGDVDDTGSIEVCWRPAVISG